MLNCANCGERMRRVHRTWREKLLYLAMYECRKCLTRRPEPRRTSFYLGEYPRCPRCGTFRLRPMAVRDHIDPMYGSLMSRVQRWLGARLFHCRYCRIQFYDLRRHLLPEAQTNIKPTQIPQSQGTA